MVSQFIIVKNIYVTSIEIGYYALYVVERKINFNYLAIKWHRSSYITVTMVSILNIFKLDGNSKRSSQQYITLKLTQTVVSSLHFGEKETIENKQNSPWDVVIANNTVKVSKFRLLIRPYAILNLPASVVPTYGDS